MVQWVVVSCNYICIYINVEQRIYGEFVLLSCFFTLYGNYLTLILFVFRIIITITFLDCANCHRLYTVSTWDKLLHESVRHIQWGCSDVKAYVFSHFLLLAVHLQMRCVNTIKSISPISHWKHNYNVSPCQDFKSCGLNYCVVGNDRRNHRATHYTIWPSFLHFMIALTMIGSCDSLLSCTLLSLAAVKPYMTRHDIIFRFNYETKSRQQNQ